MKVGDKPLSRIVVLISGSGSNLQSLIDACKEGRIDGKIMAAISNKPSVKGLERASVAGIPSIVADHRAFQSREDFDEYLADLIDGFTPDLIVLAGFIAHTHQRPLSISLSAKSSISTPLYCLHIQVLILIKEQLRLVIQWLAPLFTLLLQN